MLHEIVAQIRREIAYLSRECRATFAQQNWEFFSALASVARHSRECRATLERHVCVTIEKSGPYKHGNSPQSSNHFVIRRQAWWISKKKCRSCWMRTQTWMRTRLTCWRLQHVSLLLLQTPHKVISHFSHFLRRKTKLRRVQDRFETPATTLWLFWEKICRTNFLNISKIAQNDREALRLMRGYWEPLRTFRDIWKLPRETRSQFVANSRSPVRYQL